MAIGSNVNPNYPVPGLDQSSKGFRDNFATIKKELESLQRTSIQVQGALNSAPCKIGESETLTINTWLNINQIPIQGPYKAIQYNKQGKLSGNIGLVFDESNVTVGIGSSVPSNLYSLDANKGIRVGNEIIVNQHEQASSANIILTTSNVQAIISNNDKSLIIGTQSDNPIKIIANSIPKITVIGSNIGINTELPDSTLHVVSNRQEVGSFYTTRSGTHNFVKLSTSGTGSTIAVSLEHSLANKTGGMRMAQSGMLTFHTNEEADSYLSIASAKLTILTSGKIGVGNIIPGYLLDVSGTFASQGITDTSSYLGVTVGINNRAPQFSLDVNGDIATSGACISTVASLTIDDAWITLDAVPVTQFRSVKYIIQVYKATRLDLIECFMSHIAGTPYLTIISENQLPTSAPSLGSLQAIVDPDDSNFILLQYKGSSISNRVRLAKTYLLI